MDRIFSSWWPATNAALQREEPYVCSPRALLCCWCFKILTGPYSVWNKRSLDGLAEVSKWICLSSCVHQHLICAHLKSIIRGLLLALRLTSSSTSSPHPRLTDVLNKEDLLIPYSFPNRIFLWRRQAVSPQILHHGQSDCCEVGDNCGRD